MLLSVLIFLLLVIAGFVLLFRWLGAHHRRTWGDASGQEANSKPVVRDSTWMRGGGGPGV
jgi:hypothetical protein